MMTTSDQLPIAPTRRRRTATAAAASLAGSVAVHLAFAAAGLGIAWQLSTEQPSISREVVILFEDPVAAPGSEVSPVLPGAQRAEVSEIVPPLPFAQLAFAEAIPAYKEMLVTRDLPPSLLTTLPNRADDRTSSVLAGGNVTTSESPAAVATEAAGGVRFAGLGASNARSVVYVVDASGPMVTSMPRVIAELRRSVEQLAPTQKFCVVLFRRTENEAGPEIFAPVLMRATPSAKRRLVDWLAQATPAGASNPLTGLEAALALKPDAVFLLSRSIVRSGGGVWEDGLEATLARLEELNPPQGAHAARPTLIQTIQFLDDDPTGIMQAIGARHGQGAGYRVVRRGEDIAGQGR